MTLDVAGSPSRFDRVHVVNCKRRREKRVTPVCTGVEQTDIGHNIAIGRKSGSIQQVFKPLTLLLGLKVLMIAE